MARLALLSVSDKTGIEALAKTLVETYGFDLVSSGGTAKTLQAAGIPVTKVSDYTGAPEILGGRVKTLHPKIHGGILARRDLESDQAELAANGIRPLDLVVVNLYPFEATIAKPDVTLTEAVENIDIGGPAMIRATAKNFAHTTVLTHPYQYSKYLEALAAHGEAPLPLRQQFAGEAFALTNAYDQAIAAYFSQLNDNSAERFGLSGTLRQTLRYGENPHQAASWYQTGRTASGWASAEKLQGKELSYNNLVDLEAARRIITEFPATEPAVAILKHTNPCGVALAPSLVDAYNKAFAADSVSAFGGIVVLNQAIDPPTAKAMTQTFLECVVAPACTPKAQAIFSKKKNLRILVLPDLASGPSNTPKAIAGGFLLQQTDQQMEAPDTWKVVTQKQPTPEELAELAFAWKVCKHVKSNAIVVTKAKITLGIGAGQMNRVGAVEIALKQAAEQATGGCLASDAFFPFDDSVRTAAAAGITTIIQPGGSVRDQESIAAADELGLVMVFTGVRHFLH